MRKFLSFFVICQMAMLSLVAKADTQDPEVFVKVTSTDDLAVGNQLLIVYESSDGTSYALGAQITNTSGVMTNRNAAAVTINDGEIVLTGTEEETPTVLTLGQSTGGYTLFGDDNKYLAKGGTSTYNRLAQADEVTDVALWNISISDGVTKIRNVGASDFYVQKNKSSKIFAAYKNTQNDITIYKKDESKPGIPKISVASGTYYKSLSVILEASNADEIRFTTTGVSPLETDDYEVYDPDAPLYIDKSCILKVVAVKGEYFSDVVTAIYTILVNKPVFSQVEGIYYKPITVELSADDVEEIRFTTNGTSPLETEDYEVYDPDAPLYIDSPTVVTAVAVRDGLFSEVVTANYQISVKVPVLSLAGGTYLGARTVSITCDEGSYVLYTIDDTDPRTSETAEEYDEDAPIYFERSGVLKAVAVNSGGLTSDVVTAEYIIKNARNRIYNFNYTSEEDLAYYGISGDSVKIWNIKNYQNGFTPVDSLLHTEGLEFGNYKDDEGYYYYGYIYMYPNYAIMPKNAWIRITDLQPNDKIEIVYGPVGGYSDDTHVGGYLFQGATLDDDSQKLIKGKAQWVDLTVNNGTDHVDFIDGYLFKSQSGYEYFSEANYFSYIYYILVNPMICPIGDDLFASYVTTGETDFKKSGIKAYTVTAIEDGYVTLTEIETAAKGTPVVVEKEKAGNWILTPSDWGERVTGNLLKASDGTVVADGTHYALAKKESGVGFYKVKEGLTIPEGKVYLTANAGAREFLGFTEDTTTGIMQMEEDEQPAADNGIYSLSGVRVQNPTKGLYISNGKKMFIK